VEEVWPEAVDEDAGFVREICTVAAYVRTLVDAHDALPGLGKDLGARQPSHACAHHEIVDICHYLT
jgi:hypothetical protein